MAAGRKTGGRRPGSGNKAKKAERQVIADSGLMPLEYMLQVLRDPAEDAQRRAWAAKEAGPYCHPRLAQIEHGNKDGKAFLVALGNDDGGVL